MANYVAPTPETRLRQLWERGTSPAKASQILKREHGEEISFGMVQQAYARMAAE